MGDILVSATLLHPIEKSTVTTLLRIELEYFWFRLYPKVYQAYASLNATNYSVSIPEPILFNLLGTGTFFNQDRNVKSLYWERV